MSQRLEYFKQSPKLAKAYLDFSLSLRGSGLEESLRNLVQIRASQMNGCSFCLDMHVKEATIAGERPLRLHHVAAWRESHLFSPRERAAFAWTETLTHLPREGVGEAAYNAALEHFSEAELSDLTFAVIAINGWNRLNAAFPQVPGSADSLYGLDRAGLS